MSIVYVDGSTLSSFMDAVTEYYGADVWQGITTQGRFLAPEFASKVKAIDGVEAIYNSAGDIVYYKYNGQIVSQGVDVINTINSNVGTSITTTEISVPANTTIIETTGEVVAESGMKTATSTAVKTVMKDVALGVAAVAAGIQLGVKIDERLYASNPEYFDSLDWANFNPQTWDSICRTEAGKAIFNFVLGIDKTQNKVQPYIDENALAYIAGYMASTGAFDYYNSATIDDTTGLDMRGITLPLKSGSYFTNYTPWGSEPYTYYATTWSVGTSSSPVQCCPVLNFDPNPSNFDTMTLTFCSEDAFTVNIFSERTGETTTENAIQYTFNGKTFYIWYNGSFINLNNVQGVYNETDVEFVLDPKTISYICLYGDITEVSGIDGVDKQPGAITPTINDPSNIPAVLAYLKTRYPDLWDDAIENEVVQEDGTIKTYKYVPISIPENVTATDTQTDVNATGGEDLTQADPAIYPETTPTSIIETLFEIIGSSNPYNPTPPETPTEYPDTGTGDTPAVVVPTGSASALYSVYNPSQSELNNFGAWLWSTNFVDQLLKLFNDPMQAIIGLHKVFASPSVSGRGNIKVGYLDSGVTTNLVDKQYVTVDCGSVSLSEYFGNVFDYDPHTQVYIYLPFIGIEKLDTGDVMRSSINVVYHIDVITGACLAEINVTRDLSGGTLYTFTGNCAVQYPVSSGSYMGIVASIASIAGGVVGTISSGGALAPMAMGAVSGVLNAHTRVNHSGGFSGNAGAMGIKKPYLIITRPQTCLADEFPKFEGYPANSSVLVSDCIGYIECKAVHIENVPATDAEITEIENLLKSGVII